MGGDSETKFKEDHLVLPVATPLPHHSHNLGVKSGYQHDVLNNSLGAASAADSAAAAAAAAATGNGGHPGSGLEKYGDMSSLHLAHNRFLMPPAASAVDPMKTSADMHHFTTSANNPFSIHRFLPGGNLTDPKDVVSHYDYSQLGGHAGGPGGHTGVGSQFGGHTHESMYYPPPLYPVHPTSTSAVHSHHL